MVAAAVAAAAQSRPPLGIDQAVTLRAIAGRYDVTRNGRMVAYAVVDPARRNGPEEAASVFLANGTFSEAVGSDVLVTDIEQRTTTDLTAGVGNSWGAAWSPDGAVLAFYSDRDGAPRLWQWDRRTQGAQRVSPVLTRSSFVDHLAWTPDGKRLLTLVSADSDGTGARAVMAADVALMDVATGAVQRLTQGDSVRWAEPSPDGTRVAYTAARGVRSRGYGLLYDIVVVDIRTGASRILLSSCTLAGPEGEKFSAAWSPDSRRLAFIIEGDHPADQLDATTGRLVIAAADGPASTRVVDGPSPISESVAPVWTSDGRSVLIAGGGTVWRVAAADGAVSRVAALPRRDIRGFLLTRDHGRVAWSLPGTHAIVVVVRDTVRLTEGFVAVDLVTGHTSSLFEASIHLGGQGAVLPPQLAAVGGGRVVFASQSARAPTDLWLTGAGGSSGAWRAPAQLTKLNPQLDPAVMGESRVVAWQARDGSPHRGLLLLPSDYARGKRYPLVVWVYQRSLGYGNMFGWWGGFYNMQLLATRGYALLYPDIDWHRSAPMTGVVDDVVPGIDTLVRLGIADSARVGVFGQSSGGYNVLALSVTAASRFAAAVDMAGPASMFSMYFGQYPGPGEPKWPMEQMGLGGTPWQMRDRYVNNSPLFFLDRVTAPLLLIYGTADRIVTADGDAVALALKDLGRTFEYARYDGEGHSGDLFAPEHRRDAWRRVLAWFGTYLRNPMNQ